MGASKSQGSAKQIVRLVKMLGRLSLELLAVFGDEEATTSALKSFLVQMLVQS